MRHTLSYLISVLVFIITCNLCGCSHTGKEAVPTPEEDTNAKKMLQGIWVSDDDGSVVMRVNGDSIVYADTALAAVTFAIYADTLVTKSLTEARYVINKQTAHIFQFTNVSGDIIKLVKSDNPDDAAAFEHHQQTMPLTINQGQLIKRDTVLHKGEKRLHAYVQVNPSKYKVIISSINESGMKVDNVFYDNLVHIALFDGAQRIYSSNIVKQDFIQLIPQSFLQQSILSDITVEGIGDDGVHFLASVLQPNSQTSYVIDLTVSLDGKLTKALSE